MSQDISPVAKTAVQSIAAAKYNAMPPSPQQQKPSATDKQTGKASAADMVTLDAAKGIQSDRLQRIDENVADKNDLATRIRQSDSALDVAASRVQAMKTNLAKIVKNYPPFAIDSKERMELLRSFISLRKEIDSMTIPAPPPQPGVQMKSVIWQDKGLTSLLPGELAINAPDNQVRAAHDQLAGAAQSIGEGRQELQRTYTT
ncbi:MAG: hypothetical protein PHF56_07600 [Desulfuromonadaceae bacterium]|nr:hypothetical protein [Desulfuromonadaceae bacterium]